MLGACSTQAAAPHTTVTITQPAPNTGTTHTSGTHTSTSATPTPTPAATLMTKLPGDCASLLPLGAVDTALGGPVTGQTAFVVGVAEKDIARLGYLNCRYGLPAGAAAAKATPKVEIGVSLYASADDAAKRIPATVDDYIAHGATQHTTSVGETPATILTGASGAGYTHPTLVAASGQRTIAVTVNQKVDAAADKALTALAEVALKNTGG